MMQRRLFMFLLNDLLISVYAEPLNAPDPVFFKSFFSTYELLKSKNRRNLHSIRCD